MKKLTLALIAATLLAAPAAFAQDSSMPTAGPATKAAEAELPQAIMDKQMDAPAPKTDMHKKKKGKKKMKRKAKAAASAPATASSGGAAPAHGKH